MKKIYLYLFVAIVFCLAACTTEDIKENNGAIDASKIVFNIDVKMADDPGTKGVKTAWESGDVVYVFFEGNFTQYVKMTYNGSAWTYKDKDGGTTYSGLNLYASGKKLSAVYMPSIVSSSAPVYDTDKWTFGSIAGYFQTAENVEYTVTSTSDVTTLKATVGLGAPAMFVQVYVNESAPGTGYEYVLNMTNVKPFTFDGIVPGGASSITAGTVNFPLTAYNGTLGGEAGYYFWGILDNPLAGKIDYNFQLVKQNIEKEYPYAISSKSQTVNMKLASSAALKPSLTDNGKFVSMGYAGGPLWATGNLKSDGVNLDDHIVGPLEAGDFYKWCIITPCVATGSANFDSNSGNYSTNVDPAYQTNSTWCMPTITQCNALLSNTTFTYVTDWTTLTSGSNYGFKGGAVLTSNVNGISMFWVAAGNYNPYGGTILNQGDMGSIWLSDIDDSADTPDEATCLSFNQSIIPHTTTVTNSIGVSNSGRDFGYSIRPVKN